MIWKLNSKNSKCKGKSSKIMISKTSGFRVIQIQKQRLWGCSILCTRIGHSNFPSVIQKSATKSKTQTKERAYQTQSKIRTANLRRTPPCTTSYPTAKIATETHSTHSDKVIERNLMSTARRKIRHQQCFSQRSKESQCGLQTPASWRRELWNNTHLTQSNQEQSMTAYQK